MNPNKKYFRLLIAILTILAVVISGAGLILTAARDFEYLSEMSEESYQGDGELRYDQTHNGDLINVGGIEYDSGLSMHPSASAPAVLVYDLTGMGYRTFYAIGGKDKVAGVDVGEATIKNTRISMEVYLDDVLVAKSGILTYPEVYEFKVDITNGKKLKLVVTDGGDSIFCDTTSWAEAKVSKKSIEEFETAPLYTPSPTPKATPKQIATPKPEIVAKDKIYLTELDWILSYSYSSGDLGDFAAENENNAGEELYIGEEYYDRGICLHGITGEDAWVEYDIEGFGYKTFAAYIGICKSWEYDITMGDGIFKVYADGVLVAQSEKLSHGMEAVLLTADITGAKKLRLAMDSAGLNSGDWGCFCNPVIGKMTDLETLLATPLPTPKPTPSPIPEATATPEGGGPVDIKPVDSPKDQDQGNMATIMVAAICVVIAATIVMIIIVLKKRGKI